jgi:membrane protein implicated in regulation of membrane protease activity
VEARVKLVLAITKGLIRDQHARRRAMFVILLASLGMLFLGAAFLSDWLGENPMMFILFWFTCAWLTLAAILLALLDLLMVRAAVRRERRELHRRIIGNGEKPRGDH